MRTRLLYSLFILFVTFPLARAQEFKYYTQYMFNGLSINPAYAGCHDYLSVTGNIREQWIGIQGAPSTQTFSIHSPVLKNQFGLGFMIISDRAGVTNQQEYCMNYSYNLKLPSFTLAFGMKVGFNTLNSRFDLLVLDNESDINFQNHKTAFLPVIGIGTYLKGAKYYAGLSIPHLYQYVQKDYENLNINLKKLVFLTGGYVFDLSNDVKLKPSVLAKANFGSAFEFDLNANLFIKDDYCFGVSYKSLNSIAFLFEIGILDTYYLSYSYDLATTHLIKYQGGTHEITLNINIAKKEKADKKASQRFF